MTLTFRQLPEVSLLSLKSWACSAIHHHQHQHQLSIRTARANVFEVKANCTKYFIIISLGTVICQRSNIYLRWCLLIYYNRCPVYYDLPSSCTLVGVPGECCLKPACDFRQELSVQEVAPGRKVNAQGIG